MVFPLYGYLFSLVFFFQGDPTNQLSLVDYQYVETSVNTYYDALLQENYSPPAETLSFVINAGEVLIFNLPASIEGRQVDSYEIKTSPALSWLTGRSFFWRTLAKDTGNHEVILSGYRNGVAVEELLIEVDIR